MAFLLPGELNLINGLGKCLVEMLNTATLVYTSPIAIHQIKRCHGVGTKSLLEAEIDTYMYG